MNLSIPTRKEEKIKHQNYKSLKKQVLVSLFIMVFLVSILAAADAHSAFAASFSEKKDADLVTTHDLSREIVIAYDPTNRITNNTAWNLWENLRQLYSNIELTPILSLSTLEFQLKKHANAIAFVHVYQTTLQGINLPAEELSWKAFFSFITARSAADHVLASGNGKQAYAALKALELPNEHKIHVEKSTEVMDAQIAFNYAVWEIISILDEAKGEYARASDDLKIVGTKFFAENVNEILERNFKPKDKLGVDDPKTKEQFMNDFMKNHPESIRQVAGVEAPFRIYNLPNAQVGDQVKRYDLASQSTVTDFIFSFLPNASGLQGTLGFVADSLLKVLIDLVGDALGIDEDTINKIIAALEQIKDLVGIFDGGFNPESALKVLIDLLATQFPYAEEFKPYFDLFVNA